MSEFDDQDQSDGIPNTSKCKKKQKHAFSLRHCHCYEAYEGEDLYDWKWQKHQDIASVTVYNDRKDVCFHPHYSSGTAVVKGDTPFQVDNHYYWEIKFNSELYGTDVVSQKYLFFITKIILISNYQQFE